MNACVPVCCRFSIILITLSLSATDLIKIEIEKQILLNVHSEVLLRSAVRSLRVYGQQASRLPAGAVF